MRPFTTSRPKLPGLEHHPDGRVSFTITDEEKAHVDRFFQMMADSNQDTEEGKWYMRSDLQQAAVAWQLMDYALSQVRLTEVADKDKVDKHSCLHKALAAALKAHSLHPLPIYLFDTGCIFERLEAPDSARDFFGLFLDAQRNYKASEADAFIPRLPLFYKSGIEAVCDPSASEFIPAQHDVGAAVRYAEESMHFEPTMILQISLSLARHLLEEANLPPELIESLADKPVKAKILAEEIAATRRVESNDCPLWIDPDGNYWNDYRPLRVLFTDQAGQEWRLPRRWAFLSPGNPEPELPSAYSPEREISFEETLNMPNEWDIWELNIPWDEALRVAGKPAQVQVQITPNEPVKVFWRDSQGTRWRIPRDWRRRRIKLPSYEVLVAQEVPEDVAERLAGKVVSVNYHPGSLCCFADRYRFRDELKGSKWPVLIRDCTLMGYGNEEEHSA